MATIGGVTSWQKRARLVMAAVAIGVIAVVAYTMRPREVVAPPERTERLPADTKIKTIGGDAIQWKGEKKDVRIEFESQTTNQQNETRLHGVKILVDNREGRSYTVTGKEAFLGQQNSSYDVRGDVKLETSDGLTAAGQQATYVDAEKIVRVPGAVTFKRGRMSGSGIGFSYDEQRDTMWILDQADVKFAAEGHAGAMAFTAGAFGFARRDRYMRLEKTLHIDREGQQIDATESTIRLFPDRDEPDYLELRGGSRITGGPNDKALKAMAATDINIDYADDGRTMKNATLAGNAVIDLRPQQGTAGQKLSGNFMDLGLEPDGSLRSLSTRDNVTAVLPATKDAPTRTIRSTALTAAGNTHGLHQMSFTEAVEYREAATKTQGARVVKARTLEARLNPEAGTLQVARFIGNFDFTDGPMRAISNDATYDVAAGTMAMTGKDITPEIRDESLTLLAETIDLTLDPRKMIAKGNVRSTLLPPKKPAGNAPATKRPALLGDKEPVSILSASLTYDETNKNAEYTGQVRLFQGATSINADKMTLDEAKGDLAATGKVVTNLEIKNKQAEAGSKPRPTIGRAESFTYSDDTRKAIYTKNAQFDGDQGHLSAGTLELQLAKGENSLDRMEATGAVNAVVDKRTVTGTTLTYSPADDKYVVFGAPVKMVDAECQETSGKTLTFWKTSDRVLVDGNNEVRTLTKGGGKCQATPPQ
ncbi:MAG: LPS export ABC transporter periplasmic protein LptC [Cyanobacteria bacterium]|nr:LPS export ABC transporter periplasmic protein LptC [Cyanobacteriota bacterium]